MPVKHAMCKGDDTEFTADALADKLLEGFDLSEWDKGHVALVLTQLTQLTRKSLSILRPEDVFPDVMRGAGASPQLAGELVYALTGVGFSATWRQTGEGLRFKVIAYATFPRGSRARFDALHAALGWGSAEHVRALDEFIADAFGAYYE